MKELKGPISNWFTWEEAVGSMVATRKGLDNTPDADVQATILQTAQAADRLRDLLGSPVLVSSWYRSPKVNAAVGGAPQSAHMKGSAIDLTCPVFGSPAKIIEELSRSGIPFRKAIIEFPSSPTGGWAHVDFDGESRQVLVTHDGKTYKVA
jgi:hypothetical protein